MRTFTMIRSILYTFFLIFFLTSPLLLNQKTLAADYTQCNCDDDLDSQGFTCEGGAKASCGAGTVCRKEVISEANKMPHIYTQGTNKYYHISCVSPQKIRSCHCITPNVGEANKNGFTCEGEADQNKAIMWCGNSKAACVNVTDPNASMYINDDFEYEGAGFWGGSDIKTKYIYNYAKGVACRTDFQQQQATEHKCHCDSPGVIGKATFWCDGQPDTNVRMACGEHFGSGDIIKEFACVNDPNGFVQLSDINFYNKDRETQTYKNLRYAKATGISCQMSNTLKANETIDCTCNGTDSFTCTGQRATYNIYCKRSNASCIPGPDKTIKLNNDGDDADVRVDGNNPDFDKNIKGKTGKGITCAIDPSRPPLPPVAPPPCASPSPNGVCHSFNTAFGTIQTDASSFLTKLFALLLAVAGGLAVLLIMRAGYIIMTSAGNGEQVKKGREQLVAAIVGLLFIIFSFVILEVIGVEILQLPDFTAAGGVTPGGTCTPGRDTCTNGYVCHYNGSTGQCVRPPTTQSSSDHCNSCETADACRARGGSSRGVLDCTPGQVCCE